MVWEGRFRYSDLKEAARRASLWILYVVDQAAEVQSCVFAAVRGPVETQRLCTCRSTRVIQGYGCGFMQRTRGEAGSEGRVERRKAVRGPY